MKLAQLFAIYPQLKWGRQRSADVSSICRDSRQVRAGCVYVAVRGTAHDGHDFLPQVCRSGAVGVVVESEAKIPADYQGAVVSVADTRQALDLLASRFYGSPASSLYCVGVTGTNGKTSLTYLVEAIFKQYGWLTGVMGTINHHIGTHVWPSQLTTPDALELHKRLAEFSSLGAKAAAFEVSSHALAQHRADAIPFDTVVFTNLTRDHLDYHGTLDDYFAAKQRLFDEILWTSTKPELYAIINQDDRYGKRLRVAEKATRWSYGERDADFCFQISRQDFSGCEFLVRHPRGRAEIKSPLIGRHNVYNCTAAIAVGIAAGVSSETCAAAMATFAGVPGRMERVANGKGIHVFVDYAHTDDALRSVLTALAEIRRLSGSQARLITVFGCGGDRDRGKRPLMARAAVAGSDLVFVTSDNPRTEDPEAIIADVLTGVESADRDQKVFAEVDRRAAIARALRSAAEGDVVLIAGKGHEDYQILGTEKFPFSDVQVASEFLK